MFLRYHRGGPNRLRSPTFTDNSGDTHVSTPDARFDPMPLTGRFVAEGVERTGVVSGLTTQLVPPLYAARSPRPSPPNPPNPPPSGDALTAPPPAPVLCSKVPISPIVSLSLSLPLWYPRRSFSALLSSPPAVFPFRGVPPGLRLSKKKSLYFGMSRIS